jgi:hypothetical protein
MDIEKGDRQDRFDSKFLNFAVYATFSLALLTSFAILTGIAVLIKWVVFQIT